VKPDRPADARGSVVAAPAQVLQGVLPYLQSVQGKTFAVVCEGAVLGDASLRAGLARDAALLHLVGLKLVLVGGGAGDGPRAVAHACEELVGALNQQGCRAVGVTAIDGGTNGPAGGLIQRLHAKGLLPVVMPLAGHGTGIDADALAADIAVRLGAEKLLFIGDAAAALGRDGRAIALLGRSEAERRCRDGSIAAASVARLRVAADAIDGGVRSVQIVDGRSLHALLLEVLSRTGAGTLVLRDKAAGFLDDSRRYLG